MLQFDPLCYNRSDNTMQPDSDLRDALYSREQVYCSFFMGDFISILADLSSCVLYAVIVEYWFHVRMQNMSLSIDCKANAYKIYYYQSSACLGYFLLLKARFILRWQRPLFYKKFAMPLLVQCEHLHLFAIAHCRYNWGAEPIS